jgi:hypothetical protein
MGKSSKGRKNKAAGKGIPVPTEKETKAFLGGPALALASSLVISALQIAGVISMALAHILMLFAWLVAAISIWLIEAQKYTVKFRLGSIAVLSIVVLGFDLWMVKKRTELDAAAVPKGSMQYKETEIPREHPLESIGVGKQFVVNWLFTNPGPGRVFNVLLFTKAYVEEADEQTNQRVKALFENDLAQVLAKKPQGQEVSPGEIAWRTIRTPPFTQQQYEGILKGTTRLYFVAWLRWTNAQGYEDPPLYRCVWLQGNSLPSARRAEDLVWPGCGW